MSWLLRTSTSHQGLIQWDSSWTFNIASSSLPSPKLLDFIPLFFFNFSPMASSAVAAEALGFLCSPSPALSHGLSPSCCGFPPSLTSLTSPYHSKGTTISSFTPFSSPTLCLSEQLPWPTCPNCGFIPTCIWNLPKTHNWEEREDLPVCLGECEACSKPMQLTLVPSVWSGVVQKHVRYCCNSSPVSQLHPSD